MHHCMGALMRLRANASVTRCVASMRYDAQNRGPDHQGQARPPDRKAEEAGADPLTIPEMEEDRAPSTQTNYD